MASQNHYPDAQAATGFSHNPALEDNEDDDYEDGDFAVEAEYPDEIDYYSVLGLSRNPPPTDSQLRSAYHNLTLSFHPDKQPSHLVDTAKTQFERIQEAYEVLSDPKKRVVYDLQGAAAVRREWGRHGLMATEADGDNSDRRLGTRAMDPKEFKEWFIRKMKARERKAINDMVRAKGTITLGFDASSMLFEEEDSLYIGVPTSVSPNRGGISYAFTAPLHDVFNIWSSGDDDLETGDNETDQGKHVGVETVSSSPVVSFDAGISGQLRTPVQKVTYIQDGVEKTGKIRSPPVVAPGVFNLTTGISHTFSGIGLRAGSRPKFWSLLENSTVGSQLQILPHQALSVYVSKAVSPFPLSRLVNVTASANLYDPKRCTPVLGLHLSRRFGSASVGSVSLSTGSTMWPPMIQRMLLSFSSMLADPSELSIVRSQPSSLSLKYMYIPDKIRAAEGRELDIPTSPKKESWQCEASATPHDASLSLLYCRTFFAEELEDPPLSEWNLEGYHPTTVPKSYRGVRVEAEAILGLAGLGSLSWNVSALRKVTAFSSVGLAIGLRERGLIMAFTWRRLSQTIKVPFVICPVELATAQLSFWAVMVPMLTYVGVEFAIIRPRERRRRIEALKRKHRRLKASIPAHRTESAQQIEMMTDLVQRRRQRERADGGLFIERAEYGYVPQNKGTNKRKKDAGSEPDSAEQTVVDVTIPVAALVEKHQLVIPKSTVRFQLTGFYDPAPLLPKTLKVWYTFGNQQHYAEAKDGEDLFCPRREHLIDR